jgi:hypothetical protein
LSKADRVIRMRDGEIVSEEVRNGKKQLEK